MQIPRPEWKASYPLPGPGLLIALSSSGWVGLLSLISFGADSGYAFIGVTVITLLFKYSLITGLGRYTLTTGMDIFSGMATIPGPKNWAVWMVNIILYFEIFMLGFSSITMVRLLNELLGTQFPPVLALIVIFALLFILVSIHSYWFFRKILIRAIVFLLIGFFFLILSMPVPFHEIISGLIPNLRSYSGLYEASIIISSVGSGFSLLFYSVWMVSHTKGKVPAEEKPFILRRIQIDAGMGMFLLFLLCILYYSIGFIFLYEHGLGAPESDLTLGIVFTVMDLGRYGDLAFAFVCILALFCSLLGGLYGRVRVLEATLPRTISGFQMTRKAYLGIVFFLVLSAISSDLFWTQAMAREFIAIRLILFSLLAGLLMLIDSRLNSGDRGSSLWYIIMASGAILSLLVGVNLVVRYFFNCTGIHIF